MNGQMDEVAVPAGDEHGSFSGHGSMDCSLRKSHAVAAILRRCRDAADDVAGVDVFEVQFQLVRLEMLLDAFL